LNIFFLIGHGGSGKSLYAKSVAKYSKNTKNNVVFYDEDDQVAQSAGYNTFTELLENETNIQHFYKKYIKELKIEAVNNKDRVFIVSTGGYSILIDENLYADSHKIYIRSSLEDILKSVNERLEKGVIFPIIKGFEAVPKKLDFVEFELNLFKDYYKKANLFYMDKMDLLIENNHHDKKLFSINVKTILKYIILKKEENNGI